MGIDPGTKNIGISVRKETGEVVYLREVETRSQEVTEKMKERSTARKARRRHQREKRKRRAKKAMKAKLAEIFTGMEKKYTPATLLNTIMPFFYQWLQSQFKEVNITYGYETKEKRLSQQLSKSHTLDAYLISLGCSSSHSKIGKKVCKNRFSTPFF